MNTTPPKTLSYLLSVLMMTGVGCIHTRSPEQKIYTITENASGGITPLASGTGGAGAEAYCNEIQKQCFTTCWNKKPDTPSIKKGSGMHHQYCTKTCREAFTQCIKEMEELERQDAQAKALHFPTMDAALIWLREHKTEVAVGTIVVITGVIATPFVVSIAVGGALVLAPL